MTTSDRGRVLAGVEINHETQIERCRSCNAAVWWGRTKAGKACPFDVVDGELTAVTHFSTCPQAKGWSKR